jgi:hypothetical protein
MNVVSGRARFLASAAFPKHGLVAKHAAINLDMSMVTGA